jgi:hypothetical protein
MERKNEFKISPRMLDAGIIAAGTAAGMGAGALARRALKDTRVGKWWNNLSPEAKLRMLIPVTALSAAGAVGLSMKRDSYRYDPEQDEAKVAQMVEPSPDGGNYMAVSNLRSMHTNSKELLGMLDASSPLPDWVESKLTQSASSLDDVADWMRNGGESNKNVNKVAARQLLQLSRFC